MNLSITIHTQHLAGPCDVSVSAATEPNEAKFNDAVMSAMVHGVNRLCAHMFSERDHIRFEDEIEELRLESEARRAEERSAADADAARVTSDT